MGESAMTIHRSVLNSRLVEAWVVKNATGLPPEKLVHLFALAIKSIEQRSCATLSSVTVMVVVDRVLHESCESYPLLSVITIDKDGMNLVALQSQCDKLPDKDLRKALVHLLAELLTILGDITANILTGALQKELGQISKDSLPETADIHSLYSRTSSRTKRDDKWDKTTLTDVFLPASATSTKFFPEDFRKAR